VVERIEREWQVRTWIVESVASWSGVSLPATLAIMLNLEDRGPPVEKTRFSVPIPHKPERERSGGHPKR